MVKVKIPVLIVMCFLLSMAFPTYGQISFSEEQTKITFSRDLNHLRIHAVTSIPAHPDTLYLLMRIESRNSGLVLAIKDNKERVENFRAALIEKGIEETSISLKNFVVTPVLRGIGLNYAQNVVITLEEIDQKPANEIDRLIAELQDLGARHGAQGIACIGSG